MLWQLLDSARALAGQPTSSAASSPVSPAQNHPHQPPQHKSHMHPHQPSLRRSSVPASASGNEQFPGAWALPDSGTGAARRHSVASVLYSVLSGSRGQPLTCKDARTAETRSSLSSPSSAASAKRVRIVDPRSPGVCCCSHTPSPVFSDDDDYTSFSTAALSPHCLQTEGAYSTASHSHAAPAVGMGLVSFGPPPSQLNASGAALSAATTADHLVAHHQLPQLGLTSTSRAMPDFEQVIGHYLYVPTHPTPDLPTSGAPLPHHGECDVGGGGGDGDPLSVGMLPFIDKPHHGGSDYSTPYSPYDDSYAHAASHYHIPPPQPSCHYPVSTHDAILYQIPPTLPREPATLPPCGTPNTPPSTSTDPTCGSPYVPPPDHCVPAAATLAALHHPHHATL